MAARLLAAVILLSGSGDAAAQVVRKPLARLVQASRLQQIPAAARVVDRGAALDSVATRAGIRIVYSPMMLVGSSPVAIPPATTPAADAFRAILSGTELEVRRIGPAHAALVRKPTLSPETVRVEGTVRGRVTSATTGEPIAGARVTVVDTGPGAMTGEDGRYALSLPAGTHELSVSYLGYADQTQEVTVADGETVTSDFQLTVQVLDLEEVVVVGYGTQETSDLTGAVGTVQSETFADRALTNSTNALQGQVPGLTVLTSSGEPGNDAGTVRIRGLGTFGNNDPLVLVDGIPSSLDAVSPGDIESLTVLKDASAASIYGVRAANGVVLVTTKRGPEAGDEIEFGYSGYFGAQQLTRAPDFLGSVDYARLYNEALQNEGRQPLYSEEDIANFASRTDPDGYPDTDWFDAALKDRSALQRHYFTLAGGLGRTRYRASFRYLDHQGLIPTLDVQNYNLRVNLDTEVTERLRVALSLSGGREHEDRPYKGSSGFFADLLAIPPTTPVRYSDGNWGFFKAGRNPVREATEDGHSLDRVTRLLGSATMEYGLFDGLTLEGRAAIDTHDGRSEQFRNEFTYYGFETDETVYVVGPTQLTKSTDHSQSVTLETFLDYGKVLGVHSFGGVLGYSQQSYRNEWFGASREDFPNNSLHQLDAGDPTTERNSGSAEDWALRSVFGRLDYSLLGRYLFQTSVRYDGTSRFPETKRYGLFPSFSAGWRISHEPFFRGLDLITDLKLRASWGEIGNDDVGLYAFWPTYRTGADYSLGDQLVAGIEESRLANQRITWETTSIADVGLDVTLLDGRLALTADYFDKTTDGILLTLPIPESMGIEAPPQNAATVANRGWEFSAAYRGNVGELGFGFSGNLSLINNEVTDLSGTGPYIDDFTIQDEGLPMNSLFGYEALGLFQSQGEVQDHAFQDPFTGPGDIKYRDQNGDGEINAADRVYLGNYFPETTYAVTAELDYGALDFRVFLQGVDQVKGFLNNEAAFAFFNGAKVLDWHRDRWTPDNPDASYPRLTLSQTHNQHPSSFWTRDASYLRIKNVQLGYTVPAAIRRHFGASRLRLYANADNLHTFARFPGFDPEAPIGRGRYYPQVATYTFGVDLRF